MSKVMSVKDKLVEILHEWANVNNDGIDAESVADFLLKSNVMKMPFNAGDTVYVKVCCECISCGFDFEDFPDDCPFSSDCKFEECENGNERVFPDKVKYITLTEEGWKFGTENLFMEMRFTDIGTSVFLSEERTMEEKLKMPGKVTHMATKPRDCTCPNCLNVVDEFYMVEGRKQRVMNSHCKFCGQALDWSEYWDKPCEE